MKRWGECRDGGIGTTVAAPVRSYRSTSGAAVRSAPSVRRPRGDGPMSHATVPASCGACSSSRHSRGCMSPRSCPDSARPAATGRQAGSQHSGCPADARARTGGGGRGACNPIRATPATTPRPRAQRERSRIHEKRPPKRWRRPGPTRRPRADAVCGEMVTSRGLWKGLEGLEPRSPCRRSARTDVRSPQSIYAENSRIPWNFCSEAWIRRRRCASAHVKYLKGGWVAASAAVANRTRPAADPRLRLPFRKHRG